MDVEQLVTENMGLVWKQLHRFNLAYDDDAVSFAMEGLFKAAKTYNATSAFSTYAYACIYNALGMYIRSKNRKRQLVVVSYDTPIEKDDPNSDSIGTFFADHKTPESIFIQHEEYKEVIATINKLLAAMKPSSKKEILKVWYKSGCTMQQKDIADRTGMTQSYVSRVIGDFRYTIRKSLEERK